MQGVLPSGNFFDQILNRDMLSSDLQFGLMDLLTSSPAVPMDDPGQTLILGRANLMVEKSVTRGYIAAGVWNGATILNLTAGDPLPSGYLSQSPPYSTQTPGNRSLRQSMPVYLAIIEAEAAQSILIGVFIQQ